MVSTSEVWLEPVAGARLFDDCGVAPRVAPVVSVRERLGGRHRREERLGSARRGMCASARQCPQWAAGTLGSQRSNPSRVDAAFPAGREERSRASEASGGADAVGRGGVTLGGAGHSPCSLRTPRIIRGAPGRWIDGVGEGTRYSSQPVRCIICLSEREGSIEHVFPEALGGRLKIDRVCEACNSHLGAHIDSHLANHWVVLARRNELQLSGKNGPPAGPVLRGDVEGAAGLKVEVQLGGAPGVRIVKPVTHLADGGRTVHWLNGDEPSADRIVGKILTRRGDAAPPFGRIRPDETVVKPKITGTVAIDCHNYRRAIIKIAYELAHRWLGESYLVDPVAVALREVLRCKKFSSVDFEETEFRAQIFLGGPLFEGTESMHLAFLQPVGTELFMVVSVFGFFRGYIQVASRCDGFVPVLQQGVAMDAVHGTCREGSLAEVVQFLRDRCAPATSPRGG